MYHTYRHFQLLYHHFVPHDGKIISSLRYESELTVVSSINDRSLRSSIIFASAPILDSFRFTFCFSVFTSLFNRTISARKSSFEGDLDYLITGVSLGRGGVSFKSVLLISR